MSGSSSPIGNTIRIEKRKLHADILMKASKQITLREDVLEDLLRLRKSGMTVSGVIEELIEHEKKRRLVDDIRRIQEREELLELL